MMLALFGNKCLFLSLCLYGVTITSFVSLSTAKPTSSNSVSSGESARLLVREVHPSPRISISAEESEQTRPRAAEGVWQGSARLPSSAKTGGNENSRYNIRRDGSLSIALQGSSISGSSNSNTFSQANSKTLPKPLPSYFQTHLSNGWGRQDRKITPTELRSFSVVLSDVDVIGSYSGGQTRGSHQSPDSYSEAGVTGYRLNSNSIHRMNASWKLNPNNTQVNADQLLHFLSLFSNEAAKQPEKQPSHDEEDDPEEDESRRQHKKTNRRVDTPNNSDNGHMSNHSRNSSPDINSLPFSTWSETSRQLLDDHNHNEKIRLNYSGSPTAGLSAHNSSLNNGKSQVVLHDLILTLEKLMETKNHENTSSSPNSTETRRGSSGVTDPQQTAADLKKLMSLLLRSGESSGGLSHTKDGAQVVNIVITPGAKSNSSVRNEEKQKIMFLKSQQIQQLLQSAMSNPKLKNAVTKVASALHTPQNMAHNRNSHFDYHYSSSPPAAACSNCIPQEDVEDLLIPSGGSPMAGLSPHLTTSSTPDGFPLTGNGFLNLNHPNLQFHQALHHLVANGSAPTSINATTKTNVINIFVLNFNSADTPSVANITKVMTEGQPIVEAAAEEEGNEDYVLPLRPPVVYSLNNYKPGGIITKHDLVPDPTPQPVSPAHVLFFNKMGIPGQTEEEIEESIEADMDRVINSQSRPQRYKPFIEVTSSHGNPYVAITPSTTTPSPSKDRVNILDLLPSSHANSFTTVQKIGSEASQGPVNYANPIIHEDDDPEGLDHEAAELFSYLIKAERETFMGSGSSTSTPSSINTIRSTTQTSAESSSLLPPEFAHLSWILKQEPPPKPKVGPSAAELTPPHGSNNKFRNKNPANSYEDDYEFGSDENESGEPSFLRPPNFNFNKRFGLPQKENQLSKTNVSSTEPVDPRPLYEQILSSGAFDFSLPSSTTKNASETKSKGTGLTTTRPKSRPTSNKRRPVQLLASGNKEQVKQRVRKLMTALGYSALPTLAAGAAATWPYWVPIMATGRKRRSLDLLPSMTNKTSTSGFAPKNDKGGSVTGELVGDQLVPQLPIEWKVGAGPKIGSGTRGMKASMDVGQASAPDASSREKWIRVEVITESSSPTLPSPSPESGASVMTDNNRQFLNGEPQDVPLLKNFLKNVLSNEWNISTTTTAPYTTTTEPTSHSDLPTPVLSSAGQIRPRPSGSGVTMRDPLLQHHHLNLHLNKSPSPYYLSSSLSRPQSLITPSTLDGIPPSASDQAVRLTIMVPSRNNQQQPNQAQHPVVLGNINDDVERARRQALRRRLAANIREAETAYASAAVLPLWFPVILGNGLQKFSNPHNPDSVTK